MNGFVPLAPFVSPALKFMGPTLSEKLLVEARLWNADAAKLVAKGACCGCIGVTYRCPTHVALDLSESALVDSEEAGARARESLVI